MGRQRCCRGLLVWETEVEQQQSRRLPTDPGFFRVLFGSCHMGLGIGTHWEWRIPHPGAAGAGQDGAEPFCLYLGTAAFGPNMFSPPGEGTEPHSPPAPALVRGCHCSAQRSQCMKSSGCCLAFKAGAWWLLGCPGDVFEVKTSRIGTQAQSKAPELGGKQEAFTSAAE